MVKIREEQIEEIKYPYTIKNDILVYNLNCHDNPNVCLRIHNQNNTYEEENGIEDLNFTIII